MTTKEKTCRVTGFYMNSDQLLNAYRKAARGSETLRRFAEFRDWSRLARDLRGAERTKTAGPRYVVTSVEGPIEPVDPRIKPLLAEIPRLLLTEPGTSPDRLARRVQALGLRRRQRYYVREVTSSCADRVIQLLERIAVAGARGGIVDAYLDGQELVVVGPGLRRLEVPVAAIKAFHGASEQALRHFEIDPDGSFLYWPDLDVHLGWDQFLQVVDPGELLKAKQRNGDFNRRYGAAIRRVREDAGLTQSAVTGIADRHLRRIERGETPATARALAALAKAHGIEPGAYMAKLAEAVSG